MPVDGAHVKHGPDDRENVQNKFLFFLFPAVIANQPTRIVNQIQIWLAQIANQFWGNKVFAEKWIWLPKKTPYAVTTLVIW